MKYYRNQNNCGAVNVVDNWNICLSYCTGDFVICMGDDDCLKPCCLEEYNDLIKKFPDLNVYHAWTELIDDNGNLYDIQAALPEWESGLSFLTNRWHGRAMFIGDFCYRVSHLKENNGYYKLPMAMASDDITAVRASLSKGIAHTKRIAFQYRVTLITLSAPGHLEDIKIKAILQERSFYETMLKDDSIIFLCESDRLYYEYLKKNFQHHFSDKLRSAIIADMQYKPFHVFQRLKESKIYGLGWFAIIKLFIVSSFKRLYI